MTASDSPTYQCDRCPDSDIIEAFEDFQSLQMLTASLIFRILSTRHELEERLHAEDDLPAIDAFRLRHADEVLMALQKIKDDTDTLIITFNRPTKTFFEANIDQSRLIARLSVLLPSLQPFLPAASPEDHPAWAGTVHDRATFCKEDVVRGEEQLDTYERGRDRVRVGGAACFDREPRSMSVLPSNHTSAERELRWAAPMSLS